VVLWFDISRDALLRYYGIHSTHGETVYRQIIPPNDEAETVRFEFTLTLPGSYDLTCTPEKLSIPASMTFIVTVAPADTLTPGY
jgi:plastocyanin